MLSLTLSGWINWCIPVMPYLFVVLWTQLNSKYLHGWFREPYCQLDQC